MSVCFSNEWLEEVAEGVDSLKASYAKDMAVELLSSRKKIADYQKFLKHLVDSAEVFPEVAASIEYLLGKR